MHNNFAREILYHLLATSLFALLAINSTLELWWLAGPTAVIVYYIPKNFKLHSLVIVSFLYCIIVTGNFYATQTSIKYESFTLKIFNLNDEISFWQRKQIIFLAIIAYFLALYCVKIFYNKILPKFGVLTIALHFFVCMCLLGVSSILVNKYFNLSTYVFSVFVIISLKLFWYACTYFRASHISSLKNIDFIASSMNPFWSLSAEGRESFQISKYVAPDSQKLNCLKAGLYDLIFATVALGVMYLIQYSSNSFFFGQGVWTDSHGEFLKKMTEVLVQSQKYSRFEMWVAVIVLGTHQLFISSYVGGQVLTGIAKVSGFSYSSHSNRPWLAADFSDFIVRTMYYYVIIIRYNFFIPLSLWLAKFNINKNVKGVTSLMLSIVIGGTIYHFLRYAGSIYKFGWYKTLEIYFIQLLLYLFLLSLVIMTSIFTTRKFSKYTWWGARYVMPLRITFFLLLYSLCYLPMFSYWVGGIKQIFFIYKNLFFG